MLKTFKFRLYPNKSQKKLLQNYLNTCRWLYNYMLNLKRSIYKTDNISLSKYKMQKLLPLLKQTYPELKTIHSQILQDVTKRIDLAFQAFFRRVKSPEIKNAGYPRFKGYNRYDSFTYKQSGFQLQDKQDNKHKYLQLSKIGKVKIKQHKYIDVNNIKTLTIWRNNLNHYYACFVVEVEEHPLPSTNNKIGIDLGIEKFATCSDNTTISNPKHMNKKLKSLQKQQKRYSKAKNNKDKKDMQKQKYRLAKIHNKIKNARKDFLHKISRKLINNNDIIIVEDLDIENMKENNYRILNRYIGDAGWNTFISYLLYKAEEAGRVIIKVNPRNTSKTCSSCGYINKELELKNRVYKCPQCNMELDRDYNASLNILGLGLQSLGQAA
jgi:putative transposase